MNFVVGAIIIGRLPQSLSVQAVHHDSDEEPEDNGDDMPEPIKLSGTCSHMESLLCD